VSNKVTPLPDNTGEDEEKEAVPAATPDSPSLEKEKAREQTRRRRQSAQFKEKREKEAELKAGGKWVDREQRSVTEHFKELPKQKKVYLESERKALAEKYVGERAKQKRKRKKRASEP